MELTKLKQIQEFEAKYYNETFEKSDSFISELSTIFNSLSKEEKDKRTPIKITITGTTFTKLKLLHIDPIFEIEFNKVHVSEALVLDQSPAKVAFKNCIIPYLNASAGRNSNIEFIHCKLSVLQINQPCNLKISDNVDSVYVRFDSMNSAFYGFSFFNSTVLFGDIDENEKRVDSIYFYNCRIGFTEKIKSFNFKYDVNFIDCEYIMLEKNLEPVFRKIKKDFYNNGNDLAGNVFSALEMKCHHLRLTFKNNFADKFIGTLYQGLNDFGLSPYRPLLWLIGFGTIVFVLNHFITPSVAQNNFEVFLSGPFKLLSKDLNYLNVSGIKQMLLNVLSGLMWFFIILGVRKRFKIEK